MTSTSNIHADINGLQRWAQMAPAYADECDWSADHYAARVRSALRDLEDEITALQAELRKLRNCDVTLECTSCGSLTIGKPI